MHTYVKLNRPMRNLLKLAYPCVIYFSKDPEVKSAFAQMAHQAGAYPAFLGMKQLGVFLLSPGWDASPSQGYPQH